MASRTHVCLLMALCLALAGCSDDPAKPDAAAADSGADTAPAPDKQVPDSKVTPDKPPATCDATKVGTLCTSDKQCGNNGLCLLIKGTTKICTCKCTQDDLKTAMVNEDTCPNQGTSKGKLICGVVNNAPGIAKGNYCLKVCEPKLDANDCAKGVSCSTMSEYYASVVGIAVCLVAGCGSDVECPSVTGQKCNTLAQDCPKGQTCAPLNLANFFSGRCFANGKCDTVSGLCRGQKGKAGVTIGSPCKGDPDCGPNQECRFEMDRTKDLGMKPGGSPCNAATECCSGKCTGKKCTAGTCGVMFRNPKEYATGMPVV